MSAGLSRHFTITVSLALPAARKTVATSLRDAGCAVTAELTTRIEATRGSQIVGSIAQDKLPIAVVVLFAPMDSGTRVDVDIADRWTAVGRAFGMTTSYERVFSELAAALDTALRRAAPTAGPGLSAPPAASFPPPAMPNRPGAAESVLDRANASVGDMARKAMGFADRTLQGKPSQSSPKAWQLVERLDLIFGDEVLALTDDEAEAMLTVAAIVSAQPSGMPAPLVAHVERIAAAVEPAMSLGRAHPRVDLVVADRPPVDFLRQQAALREDLPVRRLMICRDCKMEKVFNDDYQRLLDRNRRVTALVGGVGATFRPGQISPFVMFGQLFRAKKLDPDFVCPRCQGMNADPLIIAFCPDCGAMHRSGALRSCACGHDFRKQGAALLAARRPATPAPALPAPSATPAIAAFPPPRAAFPPPQVAPQPVASATPGWYSDPWKLAALRWWDGQVWTGHVA